MAPQKSWQPPELEFKPVEFEGTKLPVNEYERRRDVATKQQLNALLTSEEYRRWARAPMRRVIFGLGAWSLLLLLSLLLATNEDLAQFLGGGLRGTGRGLSGIAPSAGTDVLALEQISEQLKQTADQLVSELDRSAKLEQSVLSLEQKLEQQTSRVPTMAEYLIAGAKQPDDIVRLGDASSSWARREVLALLAGLHILVLAFLVQQILNRRKMATARAEAQRLKERIDEAIKAQAASEQQVEAVQALMADKSSDLESAASSKRFAEVQVEDLQRRILDLQRVKAEAAASNSPASAVRAEAADGDRQQLLEELDALQQTIADRDSELLTLNSELSELTDRLPREVHEREEAIHQVRQWLDQAQGQLQNTQTALNVKEEECRDLETRLAEEKSSAQVLQEALDAAKAREAALERQQDAMRGEMQARVSSVMDLMKTTRLSLSQKLAQSQATCAALAEELEKRTGGETPRSGKSSPRVEVLRESSGTFEGFARGGKPKPIGGVRGENAAPWLSTPEPGHLMAPLQAQGKQSRSPYWFAKSQ